MSWALLHRRPPARSAKHRFFGCGWVILADLSVELYDERIRLGNAIALGERGVVVAGSERHALVERADHRDVAGRIDGEPAGDVVERIAEILRPDRVAVDVVLREHDVVVRAAVRGQRLPAPIGDVAE